jgi:hypothetical protein
VWCWAVVHPAVVQEIRKVRCATVVMFRIWQCIVSCVTQGMFHFTAYGALGKAPTGAGGGGGQMYTILEFVVGTFRQIAFLSSDRRKYCGFLL